MTVKGTPATPLRAASALIARTSFSRSELSIHSSASFSLSKIAAAPSSAKMSVSASVLDIVISGVPLEATLSRGGKGGSSDEDSFARICGSPISSCSSKLARNSRRRSAPWALWPPTMYAFARRRCARVVCRRFPVKPLEDRKENN